MIVFPNCKINLGLHILRKRPDGFHDLDTVFYPVALQDGLEIISNADPAMSSSISLSGLPLEVEDDNICLKAYRLLQNDFDLPSIKIHLHKTIPAGAGLGGGSADGAFTLKLLNKKFNLSIADEKLLEYALQLGSDCPFFILNKPCVAQGRGEKLQSISLDLSHYKMVLVNPQIHINTGWAFSQLTPNDSRLPVSSAIQLPVNKWKHHLTNDFEKPIFKQFPEIAAIKKELYLKGALYASMSGSGSTLFALFEKTQPTQFDFPSHYFIHENS